MLFINLVIGSVLFVLQHHFFSLSLKTLVENKYTIASNQIVFKCYLLPKNGDFI